MDAQSVIVLLSQAFVVVGLAQLIVSACSGRGDTISLAGAFSFMLIARNSTRDYGCSRKD